MDAAPQYDVVVIRRSREVRRSRARAAARVAQAHRAQVGQSYRSSVRTTLLALVDAASAVRRARPQLLLCNGPGTCLPLVAAAALLRGLVRRRCGLVYVESICRVQRLSLTGVLLYRLRLCDALYVQWPELAASHPRARFLGAIM